MGATRHSYRSTQIEYQAPLDTFVTVTLTGPVLYPPVSVTVPRD